MQSILAPIESLFEQQGREPFQFQRNAWQAYLNGDSGLIHSATGTGKTLAAWLGPVAESLSHSTQSNQAPPLTLLWITPLRALARDTESNLQTTLDALNSSWSLERRTGDSSASVKARQKKRLPTALITTPESLSVLLSYKDMGHKLSSVQAIIVDEWHELIGTKRGVQLELCLARLRHLQPEVKTWGLSATIGNLRQAMHVLLGHDQGRLITSNIEKTIEIKTVLPEVIDRFPWAGHMGLSLLQPVIELIKHARSTLIFTNTRTQAELWFEYLLKAKPEWLERMGLHHGSLSRPVRDYVENGLREGTLLCAVCTSSLDLGVDFSPVDQVIQIGSPKGVARLIQRAGRSGHQPGAVSTIHCVPTHALEIAEIKAANIAYSKGDLESRPPLTLSLDVLIQHCITLAIGGGFDKEALLSEVRTTYSFKDLDSDQWQWVIETITQGGPALQHYPDYHRVVLNDSSYVVESRRVAQRHRMAIGTISSDSQVSVKWLKGGSIGRIEESFIARLKPKEAFLFNGKKLELVHVRDMTASVKLAKTSARIVPRWVGGRLPLSNKLSKYMKQLLANNQFENTEQLSSIAALLNVQRQWSHIPNTNQLLVEKTSTREGQHVFVYAFAGRSVHEGLGALLAYRLSRQESVTFSICVNDYGFELLTKTPIDIDNARLRECLTTENLRHDLLASINESEMARRNFRDIARIAGLVFQGYPGQNKSTRQIQASSGLIYDVLAKYDSNNLLLNQSLNEVLERDIGYSQLQDALKLITEQDIVLSCPKKLTPLAFPLWADRLRSQIISSEKWQDRLQKMLKSLNKEADKQEKQY